MKGPPILSLNQARTLFQQSANPAMTCFTIFTSFFTQQVNVSVTVFHLQLQKYPSQNFQLLQQSFTFTLLVHDDFIVCITLFTVSATQLPVVFVSSACL